MLWLAVFGIGIVVGIADVFLFADNKKVATFINSILRNLVVVNSTTFFVMKQVLNVINIFDTSTHGPIYILKYVGLSLAISVALLFVTGILRNSFAFEKYVPKHQKSHLAIKIVAIVCFALGIAAITGTFWGKEAFGDLSPDQILINLNSPTEGTDVGVYISLFEGPVLTTVFATALFSLLVFANRKFTYKKNEKTFTILPLIAIRIISLIIAIAILVGGCAFGINRFQLFDLYNAYMSDSSYIEDNFVDPDTANIVFPETKRNLIHIYLESMENTYFSKELGGAMDENLMPDLAKLSKEGYSFSHTSTGFGGPIQSTGSSWSVASMVNMGIGLPMKVPVDGNSYGKPGNFLPGATALGDILAEQGYEQTVMFGAEAAFGGLDFYFESHGDFNILDYKAVKEKGWIPEDYKVFWGYEDDKLYEFAKNELTRLSQLDKPFHFVMETADTHAPHGYLSPKAPTPYDDQYSNAIHYSQSQAVEFIRWIQQQPFYENTTIVIIGDHLSMAKEFFVNITNYQRTCYNLILNPAPSLGEIPQEYLVNRSWALFDMFPTLLASIGVEIEGNHLGIGTNMFSGEKTLFERDGVQEVNKELKDRSNFYNNNILVDWESINKPK